jgi:hypothetical protein
MNQLLLGSGWLVAILGLIVLIFRRKQSTSPILVLPENPNKAEEDKAAGERLEAEEERAKVVEQVKEEHEKAVEEQRQQLEDDIPVMVTDPIKLNEHLIDVGKNVRSG